MQFYEKLRVELKKYIVNRMDVIFASVYGIKKEAMTIININYYAKNVIKEILQKELLNVKMKIAITSFVKDVFLLLGRHKKSSLKK